MASSVLIVNGPNLNMLGGREPDVYGRETLADIEARCRAHARSLGMEVECFQSNDEGALVTRIQRAQGGSGVIINGGAYSHTSVAIADGLRVLSCPVIEVHLTNIFRREPFRHHSHIAAVAVGVICGFGGEGYLLALSALKQFLSTE